MKHFSKTLSETLLWCFLFSAYASQAIGFNVLVKSKNAFLLCHHENSSLQQQGGMSDTHNLDSGPYGEKNNTAHLKVPTGVPVILMNNTGSIWNY